MLNAGILQSASAPVAIKQDLKKQSLAALQRIMQVLSNGPIYKLAQVKAMVKDWNTKLASQSIQ